MAKTITRNLMLSDISKLIPLLNTAEYNSKVALKQLNRTFRNHKAFTLPEVAPEDTRRYLFNNLIDLKNILNQLDIGDKQEDIPEEDKPF